MMRPVTKARSPTFSRYTITFDLLLVLLSTATVIGMVLLLRSLGLPFGTRWAHAGEDMNWLYILSQPSSAERAHAFWGFDNRNPLSPWWYLAASSLYLDTPAGPAILRILMSPLLGISAYAMILTVTVGRARSLALGVGIVAAASTFSYSVDNVIWNFLGALSLTLLSIACFAQWVNGGRCSAGWYAISLLLCFAAFTTYGFQTGAIVAVAWLSLLRPAVPEAGWARRIIGAALESLPYLVLFVLFNLIWITTRNPLISGMLEVAPSLLLTNLPRSILHGLWSPVIGQYFGLASALLGPALWAVMAAAALLAGTFTAIAARSSPTPRATDAVIVLAMAIAVVLPTALIESMSTVWTVGTRWRMVEQFWLPALWLGLFTLALALLPLSSPIRRLFLAAATGTASALALAVSLGHNAALLDRGLAERGLKAGLEAYASTLPPGFTILVLATQPGQTTLDSLPAMTNRVWFAGRGEARIIRPGVTEADPSTIHSDGLALRTGFSAPWERARILFFDNRRVTLPSELGATDLSRYSVQWHRGEPLRQDGAR